MRSCCSPYSQLAQQLEETNTRAVQAYNIAVQCLRNPLSENLTINADLIVNGDIFQYGAAYETHAEKVYTNDDYIVMREGAVSALAAGDYSGFQVTKYDGTNDGRLVIDKDGTARVGDVNDEQPLATRDEAADLTDGHLLKWDAANLKLTDAGAGSVLEHFCQLSTGVWITTPGEEELQTFTLPTGYKFEEYYDYIIFMHNASASTVNVTMKEYARMYTRGTNVFQMYVQASDDFYATFDVYRVRDETSTPTVRVHVVTPDSTDLQEKLVSGTNIKTVGGQSLLGSGDIPAGGLTWTERTASDDWTDMFEYVSGKVRTKKNIVIFKGANCCWFLPKGLSNPSQIALPFCESGYSGNNLTIYRFIAIQQSSIPSSASSLNISSNQFTFTTDGSTISISKTTVTSSTTKSSLTIFVAD